MLLYLVAWVYPRLEGASDSRHTPTPAGSWELWEKKREGNLYLQIIHWAFFHSFYSACTFVCCVARVFPRSRAALPPSRQSACLFMYRLNHASMKMPLWFSQNNTQSRQEVWHHQFPCSSVCKISTLSFPNLGGGKPLMFPSSLDGSSNNSDVRLCPRMCVVYQRWL